MDRKRSHWVSVLVVVLAVAASSSVVRAQSGSTLVVTVLRDTTDVVVPTADVAVPGLDLSTRTDAKGVAVLKGIEAGSFEVTVKKLGFTPIHVSLSFNGADTVYYQFALVPSAQVLAGVAVTGTNDVPKVSKLAQFETRRQFGMGRFVVARDLERKLNQRTGDALGSLLPGARIMRGDASHPTAAYVGSSRGVNSIEGAQSAFAQGSRPPPAAVCLVHVYLDGVRVYGGLPGEPPFDVNTLQPSMIAAVEFYAGSASLPSELRSGNSACGAIVIWMK